MLMSSRPEKKLKDGRVQDRGKATLPDFVGVSNRLPAKKLITKTRQWENPLGMSRYMRK